MSGAAVGPHRGLALAAAAALALALASPPGAFPGAAWLVLPGLAALHALIRTAARPLLLAYLVGLAHVAAFSWSVRHVSMVAWALIGLAGGVYYLAAAVWTRGFARARLPIAGFALGIAATAWLRAHAPEIAYPHGQPAHALYLSPWALGPVRWGGEVAMNALLAAVAAAAVEPLLAARAAPLAGAPRPGSRTARALRSAWPLAALLAVWAVSAAVRPPVPGAPAVPPVAVLAVEPGLAGGQPPGHPDFGAATHLQLVAATVAGLAATPDVDVVLWPESGLPEVLRGEPARLIGLPRAMQRLRLPEGALLVAGSTWSWADGAGVHGVARRVVAVALDARLGLAAFQEKRRTVPAGERLPFAAWLPASLAAPLRTWAAGLVGIPDYADGARRPALVGPGGVPFAALVCYDNAFDDVCRDAVADGARWIAVLSNEAWYRRGAELDQMVAMSVFRALETATPLVRATVDGHSVFVTAEGLVAGAAEPVAGLAPAASLRAAVAPGPGALGAVTALHRWWGPLTAASGLIALALGRRGRRPRRDPRS